MDETRMSMTPVTRKLALALALMVMSPVGLALAQTTTETPTQAPAETPVAVGDAPVADGLSMGAEVDAVEAPPTQETAQVGETYLLANFEQWEQRCIKTEDGSDPCQLYQLLKDQDGNSVAEFSMFALPPGGEAAAGATVVVPLETLLTSNLLIAVDGGKAKVYPFTFCAQIGCISRVGFTADEVAQFKKGAAATMTIVPAVAPDQKVTLAISLKGFTAGYDAVALSTPAAAPAP